MKVYVDKLLEFSKTSLHWCSREAETGTERVTAAIDQLLENIARVSQVSQDSLEALDQLKSMLKDVNQQNLQQLQDSLSLLSRQNGEIDGFIQPIMQSLQFQDRLRQNLENIVKMLGVWIDKRDQMPEVCTDADMRSFGSLLLGATTMKRERDVIREAIPGLEPEADASNITLF